MNKPRDLVLSILETSKTLIYEFWYSIILQNAKLCYMDSIFYCFIIHIKTKDVIRTLKKKRFDTTNYAIKRPLPVRKNKSCLLNNETY